MEGYAQGKSEIFLVRLSVQLSIGGVSFSLYFSCRDRGKSGSDSVERFASRIWDPQYRSGDDLDAGWRVCSRKRLYAFENHPDNLYPSGTVAVFLSSDRMPYGTCSTALLWSVVFLAEICRSKGQLEKSLCFLYRSMVRCF